MTTQAIRVCQCVMREQFGPIVEKVSTMLLTRGRSTLRDIQRSTKLAIKHVRECLLILIQHNVAFYADVPEGRRLVTYYVVDFLAIMLRSRIGQVIYVSQEKFGKEGALIIQTILTHGKLLYKDILDSVSKELTEKSLKSLSAVMARLIQERYISVVEAKDSIAPLDRSLFEEEKELSEMIAPSSTEINAVKKQQKEKELSEYLNAPLLGLKRKSQLQPGFPNKKALISASDEFQIDDSSYWRVNFDKFLVCLRNIHLVKIASSRINKAASAIVRSMVELTEAKMRSTIEQRSSVVGALQIGQHIPNSFALDKYIVMEDDFSGRPNKQLAVDYFLELLSSEEIGLLVKLDERGSGQYQIDYLKTFSWEKIKFIESIVQEQLGALSCRLLRIVIELKRAEDKMIAKKAMIPLNDARKRLEELSAAGFLQLQEVPRTSDRAPSRSFYLYFFDESQCRYAILNRLYKSLANLHHRKQHETDLRKKLIQKISREDVKLNQNLLASSEKDELAAYQKIMDQLDASIDRLEKTLFILRDT